jgi:hypothetical protein
MIRQNGLPDVIRALFQTINLKHKPNQSEGSLGWKMIKLFSQYPSSPNPIHWIQIPVGRPYPCERGVGYWKKYISKVYDLEK